MVKESRESGSDHCFLPLVLTSQASACWGKAGRSRVSAKMSEKLPAV